MAAPNAFYFDLSSPLAYLAAERVLTLLPEAAEWQPVLARELSDGNGYEAFRCANEEAVFRVEIERSARVLGLQPLKWPSPFPFDSDLSMRVATYAKSIGRTVPFVQAAFRQAFAGGRDLGNVDFVLIAAAACEMHPAAVLKGAELRSVAAELATATADAAQDGVSDVPAVRVAEEVFIGERAVEDAAAYMREVADRPSTGRAEDLPSTGRAEDLPIAGQAESG